MSISNVSVFLPGSNKPLQALPSVQSESTAQEAPLKDSVTLGNNSTNAGTYKIKRVMSIADIVLRSPGTTVQRPENILDDPYIASMFRCLQGTVPVEGDMLHYWVQAYKGKLTEADRSAYAEAVARYEARFEDTPDMLQQCYGFSADFDYLLSFSQQAQSPIYLSHIQDIVGLEKIPNTKYGGIDADFGRFWSDNSPAFTYHAFKISGQTLALRVDSRDGGIFSGGRVWSAALDGKLVSLQMEEGRLVATDEDGKVTYLPLNSASKKYDENGESRDINIKIGEADSDQKVPSPDADQDALKEMNVLTQDIGAALGNFFGKTMGIKSPFAVIFGSDGLLSLDKDALSSMELESAKQVLEEINHSLAAEKAGKNTESMLSPALTGIAEKFTSLKDVIGKFHDKSLIPTDGVLFGMIL